MKTAVIYARYSSERQTEQSIEGQLHVCTQFAEQNDINIQKSINNIIKAIENGITTSSTKSRLEELEAELLSVKTKISIEKTQEKISLKKDDITEYIRTAIQGSPELMIRQLINRIVIYDDKVEIYYNYTDHKNPDENRRDFLFYKTTYSTRIDMHLYKLKSSFEGRFLDFKFDVFMYF